MRQLFAFFKDHLWPAAGLGLAAIFWAYGVVSDAGEIAALVLSPMQWQLVGGGFFLVSVLAILAQWHGAKTVAPEAAKAPAQAISSHTQRAASPSTPSTRRPRQNQRNASTSAIRFMKRQRVFV